MGASIILVLARLAQGLAHGGELPSAQTYIAEAAPRERRGLWSSLIYFSGTIGQLAGTLLAAILSTVLTQDAMTAYGWRIPFVLGGVFGLYALYMRLRMHETEVFVDEVVLEEPKVGARSPPVALQDRHLADDQGAPPKLLFQVIGLTMGATVLYYVWAISAPAYAINVVHVPAAGALWAGTAAQVVFLIVLPLWGIVSDQIGAAVLLTAMLGMAVLSFPLNAMLTTSPWSLFVAMSIALVFLGAFSSIGPAVYAEIFPTPIRAVGLAVPYSIAVALFGGTAPYLQTYFAERGYARTGSTGMPSPSPCCPAWSSSPCRRPRGSTSSRSVGAHGRRKSLRTAPADVG